MKIDRVHFYTKNAIRTRDWFIHNVGFRAIGNCIDRDTHTELIALNSAIFAISSPLSSTSPVAKYLAVHPSGVADIAFRVKDLSAIVDRSRQLGLKLIQNIQERSNCNLRSAVIEGWGALRHTVVEGTAPFVCGLPNLKLYQRNQSLKTSVSQIDHVVLNVARGELNCAVELYRSLFGFKIQQTFEIQTDKSGLSSQALIDRLGEVQFNINEPTSANSQIQEFIDLNNGAGIQHLALRSPDLIADIARMQQGELEFLKVPPAYYRRLDSLPLSATEKKAIAQQQILVDRDRDCPQSLLMQIFTQPIFELPTFFLEFIERRQNAQGFGKGNFKALFEAVEREQENRQSDRPAVPQISD